MASKTVLKIPVTSAWHTLRLTQDARRYGLYNGSVLINENVSFAAGTVLHLGVPVWVSTMQGNKALTVPVLRFERVADNEQGREHVQCTFPTYVLVSQLDAPVKQAAIQTAQKASEQKKP